MGEPSVPELAIQAGANAIYDSDGVPTKQLAGQMAGSLSLAEDVVGGITSAGYRIVPAEHPDRIYQTRWWSLCRWGWRRFDLRIRHRRRTHA